MRRRVRGLMGISASALALAACTVGQSVTAPQSQGNNPPPGGAQGGGTPPPVTATANAALATPRQVLKGWGMYPAAASGLNRRPVLADAVYNSGITFIRVQLRPELYVSGSTVSDMQLDPTAVATLVGSVQIANQHGIATYIASVWSPPAIMKTNGSLNGGSLQSSSEATFVAYLTKIVLTLRDNGLALPTAISIQNEPEKSQAYSSTIYTPTQWQRVIAATRASFDANGLSAVTLFGPETGTFAGAIWANATQGGPQATPGYLGGVGFPSLTSGTLDHAIGAFAFHAYGECQIAQVAAGIQSYPKDVWMTEFSLPVGTTETAWMLDTYRALAANLVALPFNYWAWWTGWSPIVGSPDGGTLVGGDGTPYYSKRYWALKQLWTTVRPGWRVVPMTTTDPDLHADVASQEPCMARVDLLAFQSPDQGTVAVLMVNTTATPKALAVSGLPGTMVHSFRSDASNDMVQQPAVPVKGGTATISLPAGSAVLAVAN